MLSKLSFLLICVLLLSSPDNKYYINRVIVHSDYNAGYILTYSNAIIPPDKLINQSDVDCFLKELKNSEVFKEIKIRKEKVRGENDFELHITPSYVKGFRDLIIAEIVLEDLPNINKEKFISEISNQKLLIGGKFSDYPFGNIVDKVYLALKKSSEISNDEVEIPWLKIRKFDEDKVKIIVSRDWVTCGVE